MENIKNPSNDFKCLLEIRKLLNKFYPEFKTNNIFYHILKVKESKKYANSEYDVSCLKEIFINKLKEFDDIKTMEIIFSCTGINNYKAWYIPNTWLDENEMLDEKRTIDSKLNSIEIKKDMSNQIMEFIENVKENKKSKEKEMEEDFDLELPF